MRKVRDLKGKLRLTAGYAGILLLFWLLRLPCIYMYLFNAPCPGCGMSRAYFSLLSLDLASAFSFHPMFWSVPLLYFYFLYDMKPFGNKILNGGILCLIGAGFLINWIFRLF